MFPRDNLQRWAGRTFLLLAGVLGMTGYYFANVRFLPVMAGLAILAGVCYREREGSVRTRPLRDSGHHTAL